MRWTRVCVFLVLLAVTPRPAEAGIMTLLDILNEMSGPGKWYGPVLEYSFSCVGKAVKPVRGGWGQFRTSQVTGRVQQAAPAYTVPLKSQSCEPDDTDPQLQAVLKSLSSRYVRIKLARVPGRPGEVQIRESGIARAEPQDSQCMRVAPPAGDQAAGTVGLTRGPATRLTHYSCGTVIPKVLTVKLTGGDVTQFETIAESDIEAFTGRGSDAAGLEITTEIVTDRGYVDLRQPVRSLGIVYQLFITKRFGDVTFDDKAPGYLSAHLILPYVHHDWNPWFTTGYGAGAMILARGFADGQSIHPALQARVGIRPGALVAQFRRPSDQGADSLSEQLRDSANNRRKGAILVTAGYTIIPWLEAADFGGQPDSWRFVGKQRSLEAVFTFGVSVDLSRLRGRPAATALY